MKVQTRLAQVLAMKRCHKWKPTCDTILIRSQHIRFGEKVIGCMHNYICIDVYIYIYIGIGSTGCCIYPARQSNLPQGSSVTRTGVRNYHWLSKSIAVSNTLRSAILKLRPDGVCLLKHIWFVWIVNLATIAPVAPVP